MELDNILSLARQALDNVLGPQRHKEMSIRLSNSSHGQTCRLTAFLQPLKGTPKWWDVQVSPVKDLSGKVVRLLSVRGTLQNANTL